MSERRVWPASVWIVRHGESEGNVALQRAIAAGTDRYSIVGRDADIGLSSLGEEQALRVGDWFRQLPADRRPSRVLCSPFRRARRTAELIVARAELDLPIEIDERLRERDMGRVEALTRLGLDHLDPEEAEAQRRNGKFYHRPPGGESWCDVILRLRSLLLSFVVHQDERRVLFVCHKAVIACLRYVFEGLDEEAVLKLDRESDAANGSITEYRVSDDAGRPRLLLVQASERPDARSGDLPRMA